MLTEDQISHLAALARLHLSEEEKALFAAQVGSLITYVATLQTVKYDQETKDISWHPFEPRLREDVPREGNSHEHRSILANFPGREGDLLKTQAVFEARTT
jgi:aspartyl-tRNA(Asn)/glutamyl-tRNA(Gln) amidotransferase subunit C